METIKNTNCGELCSALSESLDTNETFSEEFVNSGKNEITFDYQ